MAVNDNDRMVNRHNVEIEADMASLKQIYNTLSTARRKLLEAVLRKLIMCTNLLSQILPAAKMHVFMLDFDDYRQAATKDIKENPKNWTDDLIHLFARTNMALLLPHAYLAVKEWNQGRFYAPKQPAMWNKDPSYPVQEKEMKNGTLQERIERLVIKSNEPLKVEGDLMAKPVPLDVDDLPLIPEDNSD